MKQVLKQATLQLLVAAALPAMQATAQNVDFFKSNYTAPDGSAFSITRGWDNNYLVVGNAYTGSGPERHADILVFKTKPNGDTLWKRTYGLPTKNETAFRVLTPMSDQVIVTGAADVKGSSDGAAFLMNINPANGDVLWEQSYSIPGKRTNLLDMKRLNDGFILCGTIENSATGDVNAWLVKTDLNGNMLWHNNYGGANYDDAWQVERTSDGGFMLAGGSYSYRSGTEYDDAWLVKTTGTGEEVWIKHYGNADTSDWIWALAPVGNPAEPTGYIFTGVKNRSSDGFATEMSLTRIDTAGNIIWDIPMPGNFGYREGLAIEHTLHHTFYVVASEYELLSNSYSMLAMDIDTNGNVLNELHYNNPGEEWLRPRSIYINNFSDAYVAGQRLLPNNDLIPFMAHIININATTTSVAETASPAAIYVYPNPATKVCTVISDGEPLKRIFLRDATGREVRNMVCNSTQYERVSLDGLAPGIYFFSVFTKGIAPVSLRLVIE